MHQIAHMKPRDELIHVFLRVCSQTQPWRQVGIYATGAKIRKRGGRILGEAVPGSLNKLHDIL